MGVFTLADHFAVEVKADHLWCPLEAVRVETVGQSARRFELARVAPVAATVLGRDKDVHVRVHNIFVSRRAAADFEYVDLGPPVFFRRLEPEGTRTATVHRAGFDLEVPVFHANFTLNGRRRE